MASTYSSLKIQLMATGENTGTWGTVTNLNLGTAIEEAIVGSADVTFASGDVTLTLTDTNTSQVARNLRLNLVGTAGALPRNLIVPAIEKVYIVNNGLAQTITVKNSTGTGTAVPAGKTMYIYNDGTNVVDAISYITAISAGSASLSTPLPVASGGTGSATAAFSGANITSLNVSNVTSGVLAAGNGGTGLVNVGTSGNVLTSNGSAWVSSAPAVQTTFSAGTTGFTPNTATSGAVTLGGTLAVTNGGTGGTTAAAAATNLGLGTTSNTQFGSLGVGVAPSNVSGEIRATNNITAYYSSDRKLKENIQDIDNALDKVNAIGGKYFDWTDEYIDAHGGEDGYFVRKHDIGVIAQDVMEVLPEAVRCRDDGSLAVDYPKLCALAFAAIKELSQKIKELEAK